MTHDIERDAPGANDDAPSQPMMLPVLPLRELVLFPGITVPIAVGRAGTLKAIEAARADGEPLVFAVTQKDNTTKVSADGLHATGTVARIEQVQRSLSGVQVILRAERRGCAVRFERASSGYLTAAVRGVDDLMPVDSEDAAFKALYSEAQERAAELAKKAGLPEETVRQVLSGIEDPGQLADLVAGYIDVSSAERQRLLETASVEERLRRVLIHVQRQLEMINARADLQSKIQEELGDRQREMFLREQLKTIQKELDDDDGGEELEGLKAKLDDLDLPPDARKEVDREFKRLSRMGREAMESQVIRTFLETVSELPWEERSDESLDLARAEEILDEDHYGLADVKDRILEFLAVRQLRQATALAEKEAETAASEDTETPDLAAETAETAD
ncbi:MAG: LON peptidase substrate-binding domain-containing protein, partial [Acidobacteriota bacterium]